MRGQIRQRRRLAVTCDISRRSVWHYSMRVILKTRARPLERPTIGSGRYGPSITDHPRPFDIYDSRMRSTHTPGSSEPLEVPDEREDQQYGHECDGSQDHPAPPEALAGAGGLPKTPGDGAGKARFRQLKQTFDFAEAQH